MSEKRKVSASQDGAQSIRRALAVLRAVAAGQSSGRGLQELADATGLSRPTVHRILGTLVAEGLVEQHARSRRYLIGEQVSMLALARTKRPVLLDAAEAFINEVAREIGDSAFLTVRIADETLCIARSMGDYPIQVLAIDVGARRPLGVSASGVAILAALPDGEARAVIERNEHRFAAYRTNGSFAQLRTETARQKGYALADPGIVPGTRALSVPIKNEQGEPIGALTVAAINPRLQPQREIEIFETLSRYSDRIVDQLASIQQGATP